MPTPGPDANTSLRRRAIGGGAWVIAGFGTGQVVRLVTNILLAHMLTPEAFGLMGLVVIVIHGLEMFSDLGNGSAVIQNKRGDDERFLQTAWTLQIIRGACVALIAAAIAWPYAWFYGQPPLFLFVILAAASPLFNGFMSTARLQYQRHLRIKALTMLDFGVQVASAVVTLALAWHFRNVWALVIGWVVASAMSVLASHLLLQGGRHRLLWDREAASEIFRFGRWILAATALGYLAAHVDKLMLGKLVDPRTLGLFWMASNLAMLPSQVSSRVMGAVLYPTLAEAARRDRSQFEQRAKTARRTMIALSAVPIVFALFGGPLLMLSFYPVNYWDSIWMLPGLVIARTFSCLGGSSNSILLALGNSRATFIQNLIKFTATLVLMVVGGYYAGIPGIIVGIVLGEFAGILALSVLLEREGIKVIWQDMSVAIGAVGLSVMISLVLGGGHERLMLLTFEPLALALVGGVAMLALLWAAKVGRSILRK